MTDGELVRQACDGHPAAYEQLVRRWSARVLAICHARVGRRDAAEELAHETLCRAWQALRTLEAPEKFGPWVRGIALRVCLDWIKSRHRRQHSLSSGAGNGAACLAADAGENAAVRLERRDEQQRLLAEVEALPEELREPIMLYYYEDVTYEELANLLGVSRATVNARLAKARETLRRRLAAVMR